MSRMKLLGRRGRNKFIIDVAFDKSMLVWYTFIVGENLDKKRNL